MFDLIRTFGETLINFNTGGKESIVTFPQRRQIKAKLYFAMVELWQGLDKWLEKNEQLEVRDRKAYNDLMAAFKKKVLALFEEFQPGIKYDQIGILEEMGDGLSLWSHRTLLGRELRSRDIQYEMEKFWKRFLALERKEKTKEQITVSEVAKSHNREDLANFMRSILRDYSNAHENEFSGDEDAQNTMSISTSGLPPMLASFLPENMDVHSSWDLERSVRETVGTIPSELEVDYADLLNTSVSSAMDVGKIQRISQYTADNATSELIRVLANSMEEAFANGFITRIAPQMDSFGKVGVWMRTEHFKSIMEKIHESLLSLGVIPKTESIEKTTKNLVKGSETLRENLQKVFLEAALKPGRGRAAEKKRTIMNIFSMVSGFPDWLEDEALIIKGSDRFFLQARSVAISVDELEDKAALPSLIDGINKKTARLSAYRSAVQMEKDLNSGIKEMSIKQLRLPSPFLEDDLDEVMATLFLEELKILMQTMPPVHITDSLFPMLEVMSEKGTQDGMSWVEPLRQEIERKILPEFMQFGADFMMGDPERFCDIPKRKKLFKKMEADWKVFLDKVEGVADTIIADVSKNSRAAGGLQANDGSMVVVSGSSSENEDSGRKKEREMTPIPDGAKDLVVDILKGRLRNILYGFANQDLKELEKEFEKTLRFPSNIQDNKKEKQKLATDISLKLFRTIRFLSNHQLFKWEKEDYLRELNFMTAKSQDPEKKLKSLNKVIRGAFMIRFLDELKGGVGKVKDQDLQDFSAKVIDPVQDKIKLIIRTHLINGLKREFPELEVNNFSSAGLELEIDTPEGLIQEMYKNMWLIVSGKTVSY